MVLCTVRRVSPSSEPIKNPDMVQPFLDNKKFDKPVSKK
jgi:hypothetical protein